MQPAQAASTALHARHPTPPTTPHPTTPTGRYTSCWLRTTPMNSQGMTRPCRGGSGRSGGARRGEEGGGGCRAGSSGRGTPGDRRGARRRAAQSMLQPGAPAPAQGRARERPLLPACPAAHPAPPRPACPPHPSPGAPAGRTSAGRWCPARQSRSRLRGGQGVEGRCRRRVCDGRQRPHEPCAAAFAASELGPPPGTRRPAWLGRARPDQRRKEPLAHAKQATQCQAQDV